MRGADNRFRTAPEPKQQTNEKIMETRIRDMFSAYVSSTVAESILENIDSVQTGGTEHHAAVMFTEVTNFDELLAGLEPEELMDILNQYFDIAGETVLAFNGTLDKFIEDNFMAFWGAPLPMDNPEDYALRCAMERQTRIADLKRLMNKQVKPIFCVCDGINSGLVIAGNIGSPAQKANFFL